MPEPTDQPEPSDASLRHSRETLLHEVLRTELGGLDDAVWERLKAAIRWRDLGAGEVLCREGDAADAMYVVVSGRLRATRDEDGHPRTVGEISRGETVGEMALLTGGLRSATVTAMRDCVLAGLDRPTFNELARACPETVMHVAKVQFDRLQRANQPRGAQKLRLSVAVLAADAGCDAEAFARSLQSEIGRRARAVLAVASEAPRGSGTEADAHQRLALWLNEIEASAPVLIMACSPGKTAWNRQCLHNADAVFVLARPGTSPALDPGLFPPGLRRVLVVLHPDGNSAPCGTAQAIKAASASAHFHIRQNSRADLARLARLLSGKANGIAFAGGGARSFSHLGVLRALAEHGIPLDLASGTSLGAIIAAGVSLDLSLEDLMQRFRVMVEINPTKRDYLLVPRASLLSGRKLDRLLPQLLPDTGIEDCWKDFACVSANITNPGAHIHRSGRLLAALRATVSIPGVFPPVVLEGGDLLVDGGVVNNLPADILRERGAGRIIACDQGAGATKGRTVTDRPNAIAIIMRSVILHSRISGRAWRSAADLYIESPVGDIGLLEWEKFDLAVTRGYDNARKMLEGVDPAAWQ